MQHQPDLGKNIPWPRAPKGFEATHEIMKKWFQRWRAYKVLVISHLKSNGVTIVVFQLQFLLLFGCMVG